MWLRPGSVHANFCAAGVSLTAGWPGSRLSGGSLPVLAAFRMLGERRACGDSLAAVLWESTRSRSSAKDASSSLPTTTMLQTALSTTFRTCETDKKITEGGKRIAGLLRLSYSFTHTLKPLPACDVCTLLYRGYRGRTTALRRLIVEPVCSVEGRVAPAGAAPAASFSIRREAGRGPTCAAVGDGVTLAPRKPRTTRAGTAKQAASRGLASKAVAECVRVRARTPRAGGGRRLAGWGTGPRGEVVGAWGKGPRTNCPLLRRCLRLAGP